MGWFDSHCHVQEEFLDGEREGEAKGRGDGDSDAVEPLMARARGEDGDRLICIGTGGTPSAQAVGYPRATGRHQSTPRAWASIGLHPHDASEGVDAVAELLVRELAAGDGAGGAVGE